MQPTTLAEDYLTLPHAIIVVCLTNLFLHPGLDASLVTISSFGLLAWKWKLSPSGRKATKDEVQAFKEDVQQVSNEVKKLSLKLGFR